MILILYVSELWRIYSTSGNQHFVMSWRALIPHSYLSQVSQYDISHMRPPFSYLGLCPCPNIHLFFSVVFLQHIVNRVLNMLFSLYLFIYLFLRLTIFLVNNNKKECYVRQLQGLWNEK